MHADRQAADRLACATLAARTGKCRAVDTVGSDEAKTHLTSLLEQAHGGASVVITKNGRPVTKLAPVEDERQRARKAAEELRELPRGRRLDGL